MGGGAHGNERMSDVSLLFSFVRLLTLRHSWFHSTIAPSKSSTRTNSWMRSRSFREARRAGLKITISIGATSARQAQKMAMLRTREGRDREAAGVAGMRVLAT